MGIEILLYIIIGGFAGMLAGLLGVGGGLIIVPCLVFIYTYLGFNEDVLVHIAIGTSLASIIFTGTSSAYAHYIKDSVDTKILIPVTAGIVIGAFIGAVIADYINGNDLRKIIGAFALIIAIQIIIIDIVMAADNAIIIGLIASSFASKDRKRIILLGVFGAFLFRVIFAAITVQLLQYPIFATMEHRLKHYQEDLVEELDYLLIPEK